MLVACSTSKEPSASQKREDDIDAFVHTACGEWEKLGASADASTLTPAMWQESLSTAAPPAARAAALDEELRVFADGLVALKAVVLPEDFRTPMAEAGGNLATYVARAFLGGNAEPFYTINTVCQRFAHD